jgi:fatty acid desaturase
MGAALALPPLLFLGALGALDPVIPAVFCCIAAGLIVSWLAFEQTARLVWSRLDRWRLRRQLAARVRQSLRDADLDADAPRASREQIERALWRQEQLTALVALRRRFASPPRHRRLFDLDLLDEMGALLIHDYGAVAAVIVVLCVLVSLVGVFSRSVQMSPWVGLALAGTLLLVTPWMLAAKALTARRAQRQLRAEFVREERRIASMAELSGGLSLAEHEIDEALRGALSGDVAQPGSLSEVGP